MFKMAKAFLYDARYNSTIVGILATAAHACDIMIKEHEHNCRTITPVAEAIGGIYRASVCEASPAGFYNTGVSAVDAAICAVAFYADAIDDDCPSAARNLRAALGKLYDHAPLIRALSNLVYLEDLPKDVASIARELAIAVYTPSNPAMDVAA
jgi:hypothetical protein